MGWAVCNSTEEYERIEEEPVWHNMTFHHFGLILSAISGLISVLMSGYLVWMHTTHYLKPWEQRHIIRILFIVPIYSTVSFLSYLFYRHAVYFEVLRDCYEAFAIASFFALLCHYIAADLRSQKDYFRTLTPKGWILPLNWFQKCCGGERGIWRTPRSGLTWFNVIWFGIFQYCFVRVFMTLVAVVAQAAGRYCLESLSPAFAHVWVMVIEGCCVTIAMYCLIQFYIQLKYDLIEHKPLLKVAAIKLVIFLSFWQTLLISLLTSTGAIKASKHISTPDIKVGIPSLLLCIEMAIFSILHLWTFPWQVYDIRRSEIVASESVPGFIPDPKTAYQGGFLGRKALMDAFNPWDLVKAVGRGFRWFAVGRKTREQDISYRKFTHGTGLEPPRSTARFQQPFQEHGSFEHEDFSADLGFAKHPHVGAGRTRYHSLEEEEEDNLLSHAQTVSYSGPYSQPYSHSLKHPNEHPAAVASRHAGTGHNDPRPPELPHPHYRNQSSGFLDNQNTSYSGKNVELREDHP